MTSTFKRSTETFTIVAFEVAANEIVHAPGEFANGFRCGLVLPTGWNAEWLVRQTTSLLHQGAKLFYFFGERSDEAERLAEIIVIHENQLDIAVLHNDTHIVDFLWKFHLVYNPEPQYTIALSSYLLINAGEHPRGLDWRSLIDEVFPG